MLESNILPVNSSYSQSLGSSSKKWLVNGNTDGIIELEIELSSADGQTKTISDSRITANHIVIGDICREIIGYIVE